MSVTNSSENAKKASDQPALQIRSLVSGYGNKQILNGVDINVNKGEIVAIIGHNGAGKSTLLKTIFGLLPIREGEILFEGIRLNTNKPRDLLRKGVAYVPQGNCVFPDLTVEENLEVSGAILSDKRKLARGIDSALTVFPVLKAKMKQLAGVLSGGERQMLALSNAMILSPQFLILDEPSLGLSPSALTDTLGRIIQLNQAGGVTILIVEQKVREVLMICHTVFCLKLGRVTFSGLPNDLINNRELLQKVFF